MSNKKIQLAISAVMTLGLSCNATAQMDVNIKGMDKCYGVVKAGLNDCSNAKHNCAGEAKIDSDKNEWVLMPTGLCKKIVGGAIT